MFKREDTKSSLALPFQEASFHTIIWIRRSPDLIILIFLHLDAVMYNFWCNTVLQYQIRELRHRITTAHKEDTYKKYKHIDI